MKSRRDGSVPILDSSFSDIFDLSHPHFSHIERVHHDMFNIMFGAAMDRNIARKKDGIKYTRTIAWEPIREVLIDDVDYKISYCRFALLIKRF